MGKVVLTVLALILILLSSACMLVRAELIGRDNAVGAGRALHAVKTIRSLFSIIDSGVRRLLRLEYVPLNKLSQYLDSTTRIVLGKYGRVLDKIIYLVEEITGKRLTYGQKSVLKYIVVREHLSRIAQQYLVERMIAQGDMKKITVKPVLVTSRSIRGSTYNVYHTSLTTVNPVIPYPIEWWIQVVPDVDGGMGWTGIWPYMVDGHNNLYLIDVYYNETTTVYVLHFQDEDHPNLLVDQFYDMIRRIIYGRIEDVETFYVKNNTIVFPDIWDNNKPYAYPIGQHGYKERAYTPQTVIYVSNVWNHAMDVLDKNPSLDKIIWHKDW